jgi:hypothetical protein
MAINSNHTIEDLNEVKCAIVEKNVSGQRVAFLKNLLEANKYTVVVIPSPAPKAAKVAAPVPEQTDSPAAPENSDIAPEIFTIGVTDLTFNPVNAIFGRLLKTTDGHVITLSYWNQESATSDDTIPYYETKS